MTAVSGKQEMFFTSKLHEPCVMNKWGWVGVPNGHELGVDYWLGSFKFVPLRHGPDTLRLRASVEEEARAAGYTMRYLNNCEVEWSKPPRIKGHDNGMDRN